MTNRLDGKVALITGAARGLGRAYALHLARLGADIVVADIDLDGARTFGEVLGAETVMAEIAAIGRRAIGLRGDLSREADVVAVFAAAMSEFGRLDILVNNAGGAIARDSGPLPTDISMADLQLLMQANFVSTVLCCQAAARIMRPQQSGAIVNIASQTAISVLPAGMLGIYGATKAAVLQYTRSLAAELGPDGIRVNAIAPGIIMTARVAQQAASRGIGTDRQAELVPMRRLGTVEDCVGVVEFLVTDLSRYVTGQCISVCGGAVLNAN